MPRFTKLNNWGRTIHWGSPTRGSPSRCSLVLLLSFSCAWAQQGAIEQISIAEYVDTQEQISGGATVGILLLGAGDAIAPDELYAYFPEAVSAPLTLNVSSIDGRYSGKVEFRINSPVDGWQSLPFDSEQWDFIQHYSIDGLAVLLQDSESDAFYPLRWGQGTRADKVRFYVNSERAKAFFYRQENGRRKVSYCESPRQAGGFKFNSICDIPLNLVAQTDVVKIHRKFGVRPLDPILIPLSVEAGKAE